MVSDVGRWDCVGKEEDRWVDVEGESNFKGVGGTRTRAGESSMAFMNEKLSVRKANE